MNERQKTLSPKKQAKVATIEKQMASHEASSYDFLEPMEEKIIRMHFGLSEADDKMLEYAVAASEDTRNRVSLMEAANIADLEGNVPVSEGHSGAELNAFVQQFDFKEFA